MSGSEVVVGGSEVEVVVGGGSVVEVVVGGGSVVDVVDVVVGGSVVEVVVGGGSVTTTDSPVSLHVPDCGSLATSPEYEATNRQVPGAVTMWRSEVA